MARFSKTVDVWTLTPEQRAKLQPGQHIKTTGESGATGRWCGEAAASSVAAWNGSGRHHDGGYWGYWRALRGYAVQNGAT